MSDGKLDDELTFDGSVGDELQFDNKTQSMCATKEKKRKNKF